MQFSAIGSDSFPEKCKAYASTTTASNFIAEVDALDDEFFKLILNGDQFIQEMLPEKLEKMYDFLSRFSEVIKKCNDNQEGNKLLEGDKKAIDLASDLATFVLWFIHSYCVRKNSSFEWPSLTKEKLFNIKNNTLWDVLSVFKITALFDSAVSHIIVDHSPKSTKCFTRYEKRGIVSASFDENLKRYKENDPNISLNISTLINGELKKVNHILCKSDDDFDSTNYVEVLQDKNPYDKGLGFWYVRYVRHGASALVT